MLEESENEISTVLILEVHNLAKWYNIFSFCLKLRIINLLFQWLIMLKCKPNKNEQVLIAH